MPVTGANIYSYPTRLDTRMAPSNGGGGNRNEVTRK